MLAGTPRRRNPAESSTQGLVVGQETKLLALQSKTKMADGQVGTQQLPVEGGVAGLSLRELLPSKKRGALVLQRTGAERERGTHKLPLFEWPNI